MIRRPPESTRTDTLFPDTTLCRSEVLQRRALGAGDLEHVEVADDVRLDVGAGVGQAVAHARLGGEMDDPVRPFRGLRKRSEEHTSELQSLMRISYAVFCLKKKTTHTHKPTKTNE